MLALGICEASSLQSGASDPLAAKSGSCPHKTLEDIEKDFMFGHEEDPLRAVLVSAKQTGKLVLDGLALETIPEPVCRAETFKEDSRSWFTAEPIRTMTARSCGLAELPLMLSLLENLEMVDLCDNHIEAVRRLALPRLERLSLRRNSICSFDIDAPELRELNISENPLGQFDMEVLRDMPKLCSLQLHECGLTQLHPSGLFFSALTMLDLSSNFLTFVDLGVFPNLRVANLRGNRLDTVRNASICSKLESLYLSNNNISNEKDPHGLFGITTEKEAQVGRVYPHLREIDLSNNRLTTFPSFLLLCPQLRSIDVSCNKIASIESQAAWDACKQSRLETLSLASNDLQDLPPELSLFHGLTRLRLEGNPFRRMRALLNENSVSKVRDYLLTRIPHDHPYYTDAVADRNSLQQHKVLSNLDARAAAVEAEVSVRPNASVALRELPRGCRLEFADCPVDAIPLRELSTAGNKRLEAVTHLIFKDVTGLTNAQLGAVLGIVGGDGYPSLEHIELEHLPDITEVRIPKNSTVASIRITVMPRLAVLRIGASSRLATVHVENTHLESFAVDQPCSPRSVSLLNSRLTALPERLLKCTALQELCLAGNKLTELPVGIGALRQLCTLDISFNDVRELPVSLGMLAPVDEHAAAWTRQYAGSLVNLAIEGNNIIRPPKSIQAAGLAAMSAWLRDAVDADLYQDIISGKSPASSTFTTPREPRTPQAASPSTDSPQRGNMFRQRTGFW